MSLITQAREDLKDIIENSEEFGVALVFTSPDGDTAAVVGLHARHHKSIDPDTGAPINSRVAHVSVMENALDALGYPVRTDGEVNLRNHKVTAADSTGTEHTYTVREWFPDETLGMIVLILGEYA